MTTTNLLATHEIAATSGGGYRPISLTLTGFRGIRSGLGRDSVTLDLDSLVGESALVAIAGPNGRGKTTIMDNLHPYMVMPSRSGADGLGSFSYYDHVFLPESRKELVWSHGGKVYKSDLVFRVNGRRKTEAYLFERVEAGRWVPVTLNDGMPSDGKVDTYERALAEIMGPPETFFTSAFSAQGKRPLSAFKNGEIKTLLADLLGLEAVREQGRKAGEVVRQLKAAHGVMRQAQTQAANDMQKLVDAQSAFGDVKEAEAATTAEKARADVALVTAARVLAAMEQEKAGAAETEKRRVELTAELDRIRSAAADATTRLSTESLALAAGGRHLQSRIAERRRAQTARLTQLAAQRRSHASVVDRLGPALEHAKLRRGLAGLVLAGREQRLVVAQGAAKRLQDLRNSYKLLRQDVDAINREAGELALRQSDLERRFGLTQAVPCKGTDLQGRCELLGDAHEARALLPSVQGKLAELAERKRGKAQEAQAIQLQADGIGDADGWVSYHESLVGRARSRVQRLEVLIGREDEFTRACAALKEVNAELEIMPSEPQQVTEQEAEEAAVHAATELRINAERDRVATAAQSDMNRVREQLSALAAPIDASKMSAAQEAVATAQRAVEEAARGAGIALTNKERASALAQQILAAKVSVKAGEERVKHLEAELSVWGLLAKSLSNDGIIALDIDDAGPTLSSLANDLLLACYGPRFTIEVVTQSETAKGEKREDFDILVHDGERDESKSLRLVSGGERVWINECLTRAIALYLAGTSGRSYGTLFCDEADGSLDPERKRMFMAMKREVLRLGGYSREFFVSQTPELTALADVIIDLDTLVKREEVAC